jgi:hypothetical protein
MPSFEENKKNRSDTTTIGRQAHSPRPRGARGGAARAQRSPLLPPRAAGELAALRASHASGAAGLTPALSSQAPSGAARAPRSPVSPHTPGGVARALGAPVAPPSAAFEPTTAVTRVSPLPTAGKPTGRVALHARCVAAIATAFLALALVPSLAQAEEKEGCPNEEVRTGPSASLPDCRAYELVTPEELGRAQAITFTEGDHAIPSVDGEHLALKTFAPLEPDPSLAGTRAIFSRTAHGWTAQSIVSPEVAGREITVTFPEFVLSPDLSQIAFKAEPTLNQHERQNAPDSVEVGPVGGPYTLAAIVPKASGATFITGANAGTASVPAFTDVLFQSEDAEILPPGRERTIAEEGVPGPHEKAFNLYEWTAGGLQLVNVEGDGSNVTKLNACGGGRLGAGASIPAQAVGAVSPDGSKIFFTSCGRLYMRLNGRETVELAKPEIPLPESERGPVRYNAASADGSEVVFNTDTPLLEGETTSENKLFVYNTVTNHLNLIASSAGLEPTEGTEFDKVLLSEDGSAVYYELGESIYRYETQTGVTNFVAAIAGPEFEHEASYTTPDGRFFLFVSALGGVEFAGPHGLEREPRGVGHNELYRYDAADGSVMCVSCGESIAPAEGNMFEPGSASETVLVAANESPPFVQMSGDGEKVFFETTARLVPQDTNSTESLTDGTLPGLDVYEWEASGVEEESGVFCGVAVGCTHLLSSGEDVGKATFLGASGDGRNVFLATAAQLVPQATPEFPNIYDARVGGGFAPPPRPPECSLSCQGVGSTAPLFGPGASLTFSGTGNTAPSSSAVVVTRTTTTKKTSSHCGVAKSRKRSVAKCAMAKGKGKGKKRTGRARSRRGGKRP